MCVCVCVSEYVNGGLRNYDKHPHGHIDGIGSVDYIYVGLTMCPICALPAAWFNGSGDVHQYCVSAGTIAVAENRYHNGSRWGRMRVDADDDRPET